MKFLEKNRRFLFIFTFFVKGALKCNSMEIGIEEDPIALISKHVLAHFEL